MMTSLLWRHMTTEHSRSVYHFLHQFTIITHKWYVLILRTIVLHSTALNSSDNLHSYPPDNHHSSDDVYWKGEQRSAGVGATDSLHLDKCYSVGSTLQRVLVECQLHVEPGNNKHFISVLIWHVCMFKQGGWPLESFTWGHCYCHIKNKLDHHLQVPYIGG